MGKTRSIAQQLNYAINDNRRIGESKRGYKMTHDGKTGAQIFSNMYSKALHDTAKSLGKFMKEMYPEVRMANQITSQHVQSYIDAMAPNWSRQTVENKISQIQKIGECINTTFPNKNRDKTELYGIEYGIKPNLYGINSELVTSDKQQYGIKSNLYGIEYRINNSHPYEIEQPKNIGRESVRNMSIAREDIDLLRRNMPIDSNARICLEITSRCGLRVNEVACLKRENINLEKRYLEIREGSKNGKWRNVPIRDKDLDFFRNLYENTSHRYITHGVKPDSLNKGIRREMKELGISDKYLCTTNHAIRKAYASERMDEERAIGKSERKAWSIVQQELGHGSDFRQALYNAYIKN